MVVGDDHVDALFGSVGRLLDVGYAAVHGDDQRHALFGQHVDGRSVHAVALGEPVGDVYLTVKAPAPQIIRQQAGGRDAVHVVVAVDRHLFSRRDGAAEPLHRCEHVRQQQRVGELLRSAPQERPGGLRVTQPAQRQDGRQQRRTPRVGERTRNLGSRLRHPPICIFHCAYRSINFSS